MNAKRFFLTALLALCAPVFQARADDAVDGVTVRDKEVYVLQGDKLEPLTESLKLPFDVEVNTNGTFKVGKDGKDRQIEAGQVVRRDGWLLNADGSIEPVFDHVVMTKGQVYVVRDGQSTALEQPMTFTNGMSVDPKGFGSNLPGGQLRLADGQLFRLDGAPVQAQDTISLRNGRVMVQKNGSLIPLSSVQIMGMSDGTRVRGNGLVEKPDGTTVQLREGQTMLVAGARYAD